MIKVPTLYVNPSFEDLQKFVFEEVTKIIDVKKVD